MPAGSTAQLTSHLDVLPTLLHAMANEPFPIGHIHGRDLLHGPGAEQVLLAKPGRFARTILVRDAGRLAVRIALDEPEIVAIGFTGDADRPRDGATLPGEGPAAWLGGGAGTRPADP